MNAHRTGGSLVFRNDAGEFVGVVPMSTLPQLIACGERVPVEGIDAPVGYAARVNDQAIVTMHGQTYHALWHEFRRMAMLIGTSVSLTGPEKEVQSGTDSVTLSSPIPAPVPPKMPEYQPDRVTRSVTDAAPILPTEKKYIVIPPKKLKTRPSPSPSSYVRQSYRKVPAGGV